MPDEVYDKSGLSYVAGTTAVELLSSKYCGGEQTPDETFTVSPVEHCDEADALTFAFNQGLLRPVVDTVGCNDKTSSENLNPIHTTIPDQTTTTKVTMMMSMTMKSPHR